ncbi:MAG: hypothetical protein IJ682_13595 [Lachnospiraceae bacterium]|nr:hypothetical protein [Lachnospiraceae bacterium]
MSAQEKIEKVLRDIHVLFSKAEPYEGSKRRVVIDKMRMMNLLKDLNDCMYDMMEEHELTEASREKARRAAQRENDELIFETRRNAEDIYAASLMYSDRSLNEMAEVIKESRNRMDGIYSEMQERIKQELTTIRHNQYELKGQLQGLVDTQKYLRLIQDENVRIAKEKELQANAAPEPSPYEDTQIEVHVNEDYFREQGLEDLLEPQPEEEAAPEVDINVDLDAEYFKWKEDEG